MSGCLALIVAAGRGHRFGGPLPKQYRPLGEVPILRRTIQAFLRHPDIDGVRVVIHPDDTELYQDSVQGLTLPDPVSGGATRQESVRLGLESLRDTAPDTVLIHDAARPFISPRVISDVIAALGDHPGALPALAVVDTLKRGQNNLIETTVARDGLFRAQTPQGFRFADIDSAHEAAQGLDLTDDAAVAERAGLAVALVAGAETNVKITTEHDLTLAEERMSGSETRSGSGFDVHKFCPGDTVTLCGVAIAHDAALEGHSDADVALHALTDALLGTVGGGDIGTHFPPSDAQWRGVSSDRFVHHARDLITEKGGTIINVDITIICEAPKIRPHRDAMKVAVATMLGLDDLSRVNVKGTTTEGLGFAGRREGIAAQAIASVRF